MTTDIPSYEILTPFLERHLSLVVQANKTTNITRITSLDEARILHLEDSLSGFQELCGAPSGRYGDMGSGAGFPGIPLALATRRETVLIESVGKKAELLSSFVQKLDASSYISIYAGRAEDLAREQPCSFAVLTARALSQLSSLMELAAPLLIIGGHLICYKARMEEGEREHAFSLEEKLGLKLISDRSFYLSDETTYRRIIVFKKVHEATVALPRRNGMAQKRPY